MAPRILAAWVLAGSASACGPGGQLTEVPLSGSPGEVEDATTRTSVPSPSAPEGEGQEPGPEAAVDIDDGAGEAAPPPPEPEEEEEADPEPDPAVAPGPPRLGELCRPGVDEASEPNDVPRAAAQILPGFFDGGVCGASPDFFDVHVPGAWRIDLLFDHNVGDLDVYVWDRERSHRKLDGMDRPVGSHSEDDDEAFYHRGPATIVVLGYRGAMAPYRLMLTDI